MVGRSTGPPLPTRWTRDELDRDRRDAIARFRRERLEEPIDLYGEIFDEVRRVVDDLLEQTTDLSRIDEEALSILTDDALSAAFRYLAGPPISADDLKTVVDSGSLAPKILRDNPDLVRRIVATIQAGLDRRRFPWVAEDRPPAPWEKEAAVLATAALAAMRGVETRRRSAGRATQEDQVQEALRSINLEQISLPDGSAPTLAQAPRPGQFSKEANLAGSKADFIVGLWDHRVMAIECKVSNSSVNSIKRLNREAAAKAVAWIRDLGQRQVVPVAVLSGVYGLERLEDAQERGLTIYWAHRLEDLTGWIDSTR